MASDNEKCCSTLSLEGSLRSKKQENSDGILQVMNPLIEESNTERVPSRLNDIVNNLLQFSKSPDSLQKDFLFSAILVVLFENGYVPVNEKLETIQVNANQFDKWKSSNGLYEAILVLSGFEKIPLKLILSPLGATAIVNLVISDKSCETYSVCLPVSRYVVSPQASTIPMIFRDLRHLSVILKNKVLTPVRSKVLNRYGYSSASLVGLPEEVLGKIILYLPIADVGKISKVCIKFRNVLEDDNLWHELFKRDFSQNESVTSCQPSTLDNNCNWKSKYKEHKEKLARQAIKSKILMESLTELEYVPFIHPEWSNIIM